MPRSLVIIATVLFSLLLTGCPGGGYRNGLKQIQANNMDFPDLRKIFYNGVSFKLSSLFENNYDNSFVIQDNAMTRVIYDLDLYFSIESFSEDEAEDIQFTFEEEIDKLNAVHDHYVYRRKNTLENPTVTIKKELPETVKYDGYIQVIHGTDDEDYQDDSSYFTATMEINNEYYVIQMIGKRGNMGYLYDDFLDLLNSVN